MLQHFDDEEPFVPSGSFRASVERRASRLRARRRLVVASCALLPVLLVVGSGWYLDSRLDSIERVDVVLPADDADASTDVVTILALGTDGAELLSSVQERPVDYFDSIVVARIDPAEDQISTLVIPRDLWTGTAKINALSLDELLAFLGESLSINPDHFISLNMRGMVELADSVGVTVNVDRPIRDRGTGLSLGAGCQELSGQQLLAYLRARHLEEQASGGEWVADRSADLGRMTRGQALLAAAWPQMLSMGVTDALAAIDVLATHAIIDSELTNSRLVQLYRTVSGIPYSPVSAAMPVQSGETTSGASVLVPLPGAEAAVGAVGGEVDDVLFGGDEFTATVGDPIFSEQLGMVTAC